MSNRSNALIGFVTALLCVTGAPTAFAQGQLDANSNKPYQLDVAIRFAKNSIFTEAFKTQVQADARELLQHTYGKLAVVTLIDTHPLLKDIEQKGLQKALDGWDKLTGTKSQFILIDHVQGAYRVQSRQLDGNMGLATPHVRQQSTADRDQLARLVALMVDQEFGLTGTVTSVTGDSVEVTIQGGGLVDSLDAWIQTGHLFAVSRIVTSSDKHRAEWLNRTLLQVEASVKKGIYRCRLHTSRYEPESLKGGAGVLGYRCLKLSTLQTKLAFQLVGGKSDQPLSGLQIHVSQEPFGDKGEPENVTKLAVDAKGRATTSKPFAHAAFVRVLAGSTILAEFPVALVDSQVIVYRVNVNAAAAKEAQLEFRLHQWLKRILEDLYIASDRAGLLKAELEKSPEAALQLARAGLEAMDAEWHLLNKERIHLETEADKAKVALDLKEGQQGLKELDQRKKQLEKFITDVELFIKDKGELKEAKSLLAQANLLEEQAEFEPAIAVYKKVLKIRPGETDVLAHLTKLEADWHKDRGAEHKKARLFVYEVWPAAMDTAGLKANLLKAKSALAVFKKTADHLTPRKMLAANLAHGLALKKRLEALKQVPPTEDTRAEKQIISKLAEEMRDLHQEVRAWVETRK